MSAPAFEIKPQRPGDYQFATYIEDRLPQFKIHRTKGQAHQAISWRANKRNYQVQVTSDCAIYQRNDDANTWEPIHEFSYGQVLRCFPWQIDPGAPDERARADRQDRLKFALANLEVAVKRIGFDENVNGALLDELRTFRDTMTALAQKEAQ